MNSLNARSGKIRKNLWFVTGLFALAACSGHGTSPVPPTQSALSAFSGQRPIALSQPRTICPDDGPGFARCALMVSGSVSNGKVIVPLYKSPPGYGPADLQGAYNYPSGTAGAGQTVAITDGPADSHAEKDLQVYRSYYGLPKCTIANHCLKIVNEHGGKKLPPDPNPNNWDLEISLDLDMVSALCPKCHIVLVVTNTNSFADLDTGVRTAAALTHIVNNSWGGTDNNQSHQSNFDKKGVVMAVASLDSGYGIYEPCAYPTVVCVGGTDLVLSGGKRVSETVWNGTGSGCSTFTKPVWQNDSGCAYRTETDISATSSNTHTVSVYDSLFGGNNGFWISVYGTSVATPIIASGYALAGSASKLGPKAAARIWDLSGSGLNAITSGNNGTCKPKYLCTAGTHTDGDYSGPAGWGTPNGISDFVPGGNM
jgi:subtilase family serine protease